MTYIPNTILDTKYTEILKKEEEKKVVDQHLINDVSNKLTVLLNASYFFMLGAYRMFCYTNNIEYKENEFTLILKELKTQSLEEYEAKPDHNKNMVVFFKLITKLD
jgi:hypothetical protein